MKILIVEDNEQLGALLARRFDQRGYQTLIAADEEGAFASAKTFQPDLVILAAQLRGGEDWATARRLKYDDHTRDIPIIGLVPQATPDVRALALKSGCTHLHYKPVDFRRLLQLVRSTEAQAAA